MEAAKKAIESGDLETAKEKIIILESKLAEEASLFVQSSLRKQITELKALYATQRKIEIFPVVQTSNKFVCNTTKTTSKHPVIQNTRNKKIAGLECTDLLIENCDGLSTETLFCTGTLNLRNVDNSEIKCHVKNIRITDSSNLKLIIHSSNGVYLQNCKKIVILPIEKENNNCTNVFDFGNPSKSNSSCYEIITNDKKV